MNWLARFIGALPPLEYVDTKLQADPEFVAHVRARQEAAREAMGTKWIGHYRHSKHVTPAQLARDWDDALIEHAARGAVRPVVRHIRRKA